MKVLMERQQWHFWALSNNKQNTVYVFSAFARLKWKTIGGANATRAQITYLEVKNQETWYRLTDL